MWCHPAEKPEILPFTFPTEVQEGQLLQVTCTVTTGDEPVTLQWYKDDMPLMSSPKFMINKVDSKMSFLILRAVSMEHTGTYTCLAFNPVGQQRSSAELWVKGNDISLAVVDEKYKVLYVLQFDFFSTRIQYSMLHLNFPLLNLLILCEIILL